MNESPMQVVLLRGGITPERKTEGSAAYDLSTPVPLALDVGLHKIPLAIRIKLPKNTFGNMRCRSSLSKRGVSVEAGVIDEDYRGEVCVMLRVREALTLPKGHAIAQLIVQPCVYPPVILVSFMDETDRGMGGFGSTDLNYH